MAQSLPPLDQLRPIAEVLFKSGMYKGIKNSDQALAKMLWGWELGLPPIGSLTGIYVMFSKSTGMPISDPTLSATAMSTLMAKHGLVLKTKIFTDKLSEIDIYKDGEFHRTASFSWDDAVKAELTVGANTDNYRRYAKNMLQARNVANIAKSPEGSVCFGGAPVYLPEEMGLKVDGDGNPVEDDGRFDITPLRTAANEELALRGEPPMPTKEEAKAAGLKSPARNKTKAEQAQEAAEKSEPAQDSAAASKTAEPSMSQDAPANASVTNSPDPAQSGGKPERPGKDQKVELLNFGMSQGLKKEDCDAALAAFLTNNKVVPDGVPLKQFMDHWTWQHYDQIKEMLTNTAKG